MAIKSFNGFIKGSDTYKCRDDRANNLGTASSKNSTSVVTDSTDLVESGAVFDVVKGSVGFVTTGKNLLNNTATNKSTSDLSFTVNADKSVTINGTATANSILALNNNFDSTALAGCLANGLSNISGLSYRVTTNDYATTYQIIEEDDTAIIDNGSGLSFYIRVANGTVCDNVTIYPMIRRADIIDATYEPYHESVADSLEEKADNSVIAPVENGANPTKAYAVGEHFIRNGKFCTITGAVTTSSTWVEGSNYTSGDVADFLKLEIGNFNTPATNVTFGTTQYMKYGKVMNVRLTFTASEEIARATDIGKCPYGRAGSYNQYLTSLDGKVFYLTATGAIRNDEVLQTGTYTVIGTVMV